MNRVFRIFTFAATMAGVAVSTTLQADDTMSVGDLPSHFGDEMPDVDYVGDFDQDYFPEQINAPLQHMPSRYGCEASGCNRTGCMGGCSSRGSRLKSAMNGNRNSWRQVESLLWFPRDRRTPPLAGSAPSDRILPFSTDFGNDVDSGLAPGIRIDAGQYFADGHIGLGARIWTLFEQEEDFQTPDGGPPAGLTPPGSRNFLVPFQNIAPAPFDNAFGLQISRDPSTGGPPLQGNLGIDTDLRIVGSELYTKLLVGRGSQYKLELLGGYTYFNIRDRLALDARVVTDIGQDTRFWDSYEAENHFHGGQIGVQSSVNQGRWNFTATNKVHLGNIEHRVLIDGRSQTGPFNDAPTLVNAERGLFAKDDFFTQDSFTFAPEMNFKLGYQMRDHVRFSVGYSLIYWDSVALAGEQIDPVVDARRIENLGLAVNEPDYVFQDTAFFVQGVDLGVTIDY